MIPMTHQLRQKIKIYIKNKLDISELIKDVSIKGEDLSGAIIKDFNRMKDNISNCNFSRAIIGQENKVTNLSKTIMRNCIFKSTTFLGTTWMRRVDARGSNFNEAFMPYVEGQYGDFINCTFCSTFFRLGSREWKGAKIDGNLFKELNRAWNVEIIIKKK